MNQFCDKCGSQINPTTGTCPNCAPNQVTNSETKTKTKKPMNKKAMIIGAIAIVVAFSIVLGIGGILGYVIGKGEAKLPDSYNEIVEKYKLVMAGEEDDEKTLSNKLIDKFKESENYEICYSLTDINDDDVDELIVGGRFEDDKNAETYDIYTMDASGKAEQVFDVNSFSENTEITIYNEVIKVTEEDDDYLHFTYNVLPEKECIVKVDEEYYKENDKYYEVIHNETTADEKNEISEETFEEADNKYDGEELDLEWVKVVLEEDNKEKEPEAQSGAYIDVNRRSEKADMGYGSVKYNITEIPQIYGEENEEITRINNAINKKYEEFYDEAMAINSKLNFPGEPAYDFYALPTSTDRYLNLVYEFWPAEIKFNSFTDYGSVTYSHVYDKETGKELTIEEAYQMAGTSEQEIKADVKASMQKIDYIDMSMFTIASISFRMLEDGTPQFLVAAYTYSDYWGAWLFYHTWNNGEAKYMDYDTDYYLCSMPFDYNEVDGEYSCGKLYCQKLAEYNRNIDDVIKERKSKTATLVLDHVDFNVTDPEWYTRVILKSDKKTFALIVNYYEGFNCYLGDYTILSDGTIKCTVTDDKEISTNDITEFTLTPISDSEYRIDTKNGEFDNAFGMNDIFVNNYN